MTAKLDPSGRRHWIAAVLEVRRQVRRGRPDCGPKAPSRVSPPDVRAQAGGRSRCGDERDELEVTARGSERSVIRQACAEPAVVRQPERPRIDRHLARRDTTRDKSASLVAPREESGGGWGRKFAAELRSIARADGQPAPAVIETDEVPNVGAGPGLVAVNPNWMARVSSNICGDDARCERDLVRGIAGHEWGHVEDARRGGSRADEHGQELDADRTAGRVLRQSGASAAPLIRLLQSEAATETASHPGAERRTHAVLAGHGGAGSCHGRGQCRCDPWALRGSSAAGQLRGTTPRVGASCAD